MAEPHVSGPSVLSNGRFFHPLNLDEASLANVSEGQDALIVDGISHPLFEGESLDDHVRFLAPFHQGRCSKKVEKSVREFRKKIERSRGVDSVIGTFPGESEIVKSIMLGIFPRFASFHKKNKVGALLSGERFDRGSFANLLVDRLNPGDRESYNQCLARAERLDPEDNGLDLDLLEAEVSLERPSPWRALTDKLGLRSASTASKIERILNNRYGLSSSSQQEEDNLVYLEGGKLFRVVPKKHPSETTIRLGGMEYAVSTPYGITLRSILKGPIKKELVAEAKLDLLKRMAPGSGERFDESEAQRLGLAMFFSGFSRFEMDGFGFVKRGKKYHAFVKVPSYVLRGEGNDLFLFPEATVGIPVKADRGGGNIQFGAPKVLNQYGHPFLSGHGSGQSICLGGYRYSTRNGEVGRGVESLSIGVQVLTQGYDARSRTMHPYRKLTRSNFRNRISSKHSKIKSGEVKITN